MENSTEKIIQEILSTGELVGTKAYEAALVAAYVQGWLCLLGCVANLSVIFISWFVARKVVKEIDDGTPYTVAAIFSLLCFILLCLQVADTVMRLFATEWVAIEKILNSIA